MLSARSQEIDRVSGLMLGADDYITKPFSLAVLRARVNARIRSVENKEFVGYQSERFMFNFQEMMYMVSEEQIELSKTEQKLLRMLIENKDFSINIIGELSGFSDRSNFHRQFVKLVGCSPKQWRESDGKL